MEQIIVAELISFGKIALIAGVVVWLTTKLQDNHNSLKRNLLFQKMRTEQDQSILNLRLQAYERLLVYLDRISIPNLIGRLQTSESNAHSLSTHMTISIKKEMEHNVTQQLYTSDKLWEIIELISNDLTNAINQLTVDDDNKELTMEQYINKLFTYHQLQGDALLNKGRKAIKEEMTAYI